MISKRKQWLEDVVEETINSDNNVFSDEFYNNKATSQEILHVETFSNTLLEDCNLYAIETAKAPSVDLSFSADGQAHFIPQAICCMAFRKTHIPLMTRSI